MVYLMANGKPMTRADREKYRIAEELGLTEKLLAVGWSGLTSAESGRIGGLLSRRLQEEDRRGLLS